MTPYIAIGLLLLVSGGVALIIVLLGATLGPAKPNPRKLRPYESGMVPVGEAILKSGVEGDGPAIFRKTLLERLTKALNRKGAVRAATFFENLDTEEV